MAPAEVRIERVTPDLWQPYREVRLRMLREAPRAYGSTYAEASTRTDAEWQAFVTNARLWLAWAGEDVVGSVGMWADPALPAGSTYLVGMWVDPEQRGSGVADALVAAVLEGARAEGHSRVVLDVADENARARAFYDRLGFLPTGRASALPWDGTITETELAREL